MLQNFYNIVESFHLWTECMWSNRKFEVNNNFATQEITRELQETRQKYQTIKH